MKETRQSKQCKSLIWILIFFVLFLSIRSRKAKPATLTLTFYSGGEEKQRRKRSKIIGEDFSENCQGYWEVPVSVSRLLPIFGGLWFWFRRIYSRKIWCRKKVSVLSSVFSTFKKYFVSSMCRQNNSHLHNSLSHPVKVGIPIGNFSSFLHFGFLTSSFLYNSTLFLDDANDAVDHDDVGDGDN